MLPSRRIPLASLATARDAVGRVLCHLPTLTVAVLLASTAIALANQASGGGFHATFTGSISPTVLPRHRLAPITLRLHAEIRPLPARRPPHLRRLRIEVNRHAHLSTAGIPSCPIKLLRALSTAEARRRCPRSIVGSGTVAAHIDIPEQAPFPSHGRLLAFYSRYHGHPALLGHVFGTEPTRTSIVLPITISDHGNEGFGTAFSVQMPEIGEEWGYITGIDLTIGRRFRYRHRPASFISASCPAPSDISKISFIAARGTYFLADGRVVHRLLASTCSAA